MSPVLWNGHWPFPPVLDLNFLPCVTLDKQRVHGGIPKTAGRSCLWLQRESRSQGYRGWEDGPVVKNAGCFSRGFRFTSQNPQAGSQPSATPGSEDPASSSGLCEYQACRCCTDVHAGKTSTQIQPFLLQNNTYVLYYFMSMSVLRAWVYMCPLPAWCS